MLEPPFAPGMTEKTLSAELLRKMDAYWRAANYLSVGQGHAGDPQLEMG